MPIGPPNSATTQPFGHQPLWKTKLFNAILRSRRTSRNTSSCLPRSTSSRLGYLPPPPPPIVVCVPETPNDTGHSFNTSSPTCGGSSSSSSGSTAGSYDPNSLSGPSGYGSSHFVSGATQTAFPYQIDFENSSTATAPAQQVTITDQLDPNLDLSTFQLTGIGWGDTVLTIPPGTQDYQTTVSMTYDGVTFNVLVNATLDYTTRQLIVTFQSINPATSLPPSVLAGFLPPEDGTGRGEGYVSYLIAPNAGLATGTQITNVASIVFDGNTPIATDQVDDEDPSQGISTTKQALITIDNTKPTSTMTPLPSTETSTSFTVSWSGSDAAGSSGVGKYNVYVSDNGGPFQPFLVGTTETSATFTGQAGHTYAFYSVATSNVGIQQTWPTGAEAQTNVTPTPTPTPHAESHPDADSDANSHTDARLRLPPQRRRRLRRQSHAHSSYDYRRASLVHTQIEQESQAGGQAGADRLPARVQGPR